MWACQLECIAQIDPGESIPRTLVQELSRYILTGSQTYVHGDVATNSYWTCKNVRRIKIISDDTLVFGQMMSILINRDLVEVIIAGHFTSSEIIAHVPNSPHLRKPIVLVIGDSIVCPGKKVTSQRSTNAGFWTFDPRRCHNLTWSSACAILQRLDKDTIKIRETDWYFNRILPAKNDGTFTVVHSRTWCSLSNGTGRSEIHMQK